ncbi:hypothetical protein QM565_31295 [Geitlerinema splendidum]|nr:hypothetical protein [Geitlerinema splendidum]
MPLLVAYEVLALAYKKGLGDRNHTLILENIGNVNPAPLPTKEYANYNQTFALLVLNASIIEGTVRSILSELIYNDYDSQAKIEVQAGRSEPSKPQQLLQKFRYEVEVQGGWEKLKEQFSFYFDLSIDSTLSEDTKEAINTLFVLRNVLAHGTALVHPNTPMDASMKAEYPYNWQRKLQQARVYLEKHFGHTDIFDNLAEFAVPEHFLKISKQFFSELSTAFGDFPERAAKTVLTLHNYEFGFVSLSR